MADSIKPRKRTLIHTRIYQEWQRMKRRCYNKSTIRFENWGGRGIIVCPEWKNSFQTFNDWAYSNGYADHLQLDRINNDGNYEPGNCRWATRKENANNTRKNIFVEYNGLRKTIAQWSELYPHILYHTLYYRLVKRKWSFEKAINEKVAIGRRRNSV